MKYIFLVFILLSSYLIARQLVWSDVITRYVVAHYETTRCNKYKSDRANGQPICSLDEAACEKSKKLWADYIAYRDDYRHHRWGGHLFEILKGMFKSEP